ncbi:hypothetical protein DDT91_05565 [Algoriphagus sp. AK58]|nr:hypothetical protein [Algoriphagus sp. AK58]
MKRSNEFLAKSKRCKDCFRKNSITKSPLRLKYLGENRISKFQLVVLLLQKLDIRLFKFDIQTIGKNSAHQIMNEE